MDNHRATSCACPPRLTNYFDVVIQRQSTACALQRGCMALKPNAGTCRIQEQILEDLPSGLTLTFEVHAGGTRLVLGGPSLRGGYREILFDAEGRVIATGPVLKKVHM
jgi:hypothetical protein